MIVYFLRNTLLDVFDKFKEFKPMVANKFDRSIKVLKAETN